MNKLDFKNSRKTILIVEDELINQELLKNFLEDSYDLLVASDGLEAINIIKEYKHNISLILLDLFLPGLNGKDILKRLKSNDEYKNIPVIIITSDIDSEEETLNIGAIDFIPKPYPAKGIILARVKRIIELFEKSQLISETERDNLTNLYNKEYFMHYVEEIDTHYNDISMDAIAIDISRFHIIVERFGSKYADSVLIALAHKIRDVINKLGGIVCRKEEDTFLIYVPHVTDLRKLLDDILDNLFVGNLSKAKARLKMGVYENVSKLIPIETRFERACFALNKINNNLVDNIAIYDSKLHEKEVFEEQLIDDFKQAIADKEFMVYYQPKFFIQKDDPELTSAEALVRWNHKKLGLIPPSTFIPLFEENGLIQELDNYVWNETANQIKLWKDKYNKSVKVSVNVSRIDIYDPNLIDKFKNIIKDNKLSFDELILEITESAYTSDVDIIINRVNELKDLGFIIEMDDFGTGYSSLNMISSLPLDALKLDMSFVREAFSEKKDTKIIELIINLATKLSLKVVAEGVETIEQHDALKELGCDIVQGYYYSKPIPATDFERFLGDK